MRILIVEDEVKIRTGLASLVGKLEGHTVVGEASNGSEGLEMVMRTKPDLVITDIRMPEMDGLEMLEALKERGIHQHAVILSGYSEFGYAQHALRLGADDYLLKPLAATDVTALLDRIAERLEVERAEWLSGTGALIREVMLGTDQSTAAAVNIDKELVFANGNVAVGFMGYLGRAGTVEKVAFQRMMEEILLPASRAEVYTFYHDNPREIGCLVCGVQEPEEIIDIFDTALSKNTQGFAEGMVCSAEIFRNSADMYGATGRLRDYILYNIILGRRKIITNQSTKEIRVDAFQYPLQIVQALRKAICNLDGAGARQAADDFVSAMKAGHYVPAKVKNAFVQCCGFILNTVSEFDQPLYERLEEEGMLGRVGEALTFEELEGGFTEMITRIVGAEEKRDDIRNYVIMKALKYVRENYQRGITLEEVAGKLDITPEYLSTLFNREVGVNFSTFIRRFRISHAKRLLRGSDMKIYEIAQTVGYSDVKYFNRVFKEEIGISPKEFKQS